MFAVSRDRQTLDLRRPSVMAYPAGAPLEEAHTEDPVWTKSFLPHYAGGATATERRAAWGNASASLMEIRCNGPIRHNCSSQSSRLLVMLEEVGDRLEWRTDPKAPSLKTSSPNQMAFAPAGTSIWEHSDHIRYLRHITISFQRPTLPELIEDRGAGDVTEPRMMFFDARLFHLAKLFEAEILENTLDTLYGDSLAVALAAALSRTGRSEAISKRKGGLTRNQMSRVAEVMEARFSEPLRLRELAELTQLSQSYFCRAFKASFGMPPHRWHLEIRIRKAREQLLEGKLGLVDIALHAGFSDQAHFTRVFSRVAGTSPGSWRRQRTA